MQQSMTELTFNTSGRGMSDVTAELAAWLQSSRAGDGLL